MFADPSPSTFDLNFSLFGIRVRVHPSFWLFSAILGWQFMDRFGFTYLLVWIACSFLSVLVHELGHVTMGILSGKWSHIVLYSFGGLAIGNLHDAKRWQRIAIFLAGPAAGFALFGLVMLFRVYALDQIDPAINNLLLRRGVMMLLFMNLFWNLLNLVPVFPLDGGQVMREICTSMSPRNGLSFSLGLSFVIAGLIAVYSAIVMNRRDLPYPPLDPLFNIILFALMSVQCFQMMQAVNRERRRWEQDEEQW
ncbi:MAG: M50 family metallopeptidase [Planctomycetes bacterium]|nr:M50 family metallopeptidase [Planctomycetota bacterium]